MRSLLHYKQERVYQMTDPSAHNLCPSPHSNTIATVRSWRMIGAARLMLLSSHDLPLGLIFILFQPSPPLDQIFKIKKSTYKMSLKFKAVTKDYDNLVGLIS